MRIKRVQEISNLGIYRHYSSSSELPDFQFYNVIYGWNGTGKTTLSRAFSALGSQLSPVDFPDMSASFLLDSGEKVSVGDSIDTPILVFNQDYVDANVNFGRQHSKSISVVLGEQNKSLLDKIKSDQALLATADKQIRELNDKLADAKKSRGREFTNVAKTISQATKNAVVRNYNKTNAEAAFKRTISFQALSENDLNDALQAVFQQSKATIEKVSIGQLVASIDFSLSLAGKLLEESVESTVIRRLRDNPDIANWVEKGLDLHDRHDSDICEFCGNQISEQRLYQLHQHFNEADQKLKSDIDELSNAISQEKNQCQNISILDPLHYYNELQAEVKVIQSDIRNKTESLTQYLDDIVQKLKDKRSNTSSAMHMNNSKTLSDWESAVDNLNDLIERHNAITDDFVTRQQAASNKIENHYLSSIKTTVDQLDRRIKNTTDELQSLTDGDASKNIRSRDSIAKDIENNLATISSTKLGCQKLNTAICSFLGTREIQFKDDGPEGFSLFRQNKPATHLSEGEKTSIAFIFFVTDINSRLSSGQNGILVIDDPVSSLDSTHQFQAFSYMKNATKYASQVFILTHNFSFLKLTLNWVKHARKGKVGIYMITNSISGIDHKRDAALARIDPLLENFETEYQYLFKLVCRYQSNGTVENAYTMPNICRKLLDTYLLYRVPIKGTTYDRLNELNYAEEKKSEIYKFVNDSSHITGDGFDPSLVSETKRCVELLLDLIKETDPEHYRYMENSLAV
jgi:wobble nucleotide-excising tRNase